jgi:hypothetical protein
VFFEEKPNGREKVDEARCGKSCRTDPPEAGIE